MEQATERNVTFFRFEDLRIYHKALDYITWVHETSNDFPVDESGSLTAKFIDSAQCIALYIAEGSARNKSQFIYYLKMAKSSVRDCLVLTSIARNLNFIDDAQDEHSRNSLMEMTKMLGALISSLQRSNQHHNGED